MDIDIFLAQKSNGNCASFKKYGLYLSKLKDMSDEELTKYLKKNSFYIEGALLIKYKDEMILALEAWDLIDQLLSYFVKALHQLQIEGIRDVVFSFPDQPLEVKLEHLQSKMFISIGSSKKHRLPIDEFTHSLLTAAEYFFDRAMKTSNLEYADELKLIQDIQNHKPKWP